MSPHVLVLNAGSSSLKFALFRASPTLTRVAYGAIERIGDEHSELKIKRSGETDARRRPVRASDHASCFELIWDQVTSAEPKADITAVAHRVVHGGPRLFEPQRITNAVLAELRNLSPFDPQHLPAEIALIETVRARFAQLPQIACFDTAFHRDLPTTARLLPIPRRYESAGVRRYGFHGLSYQFLLDELSRLGDSAARNGRVVFAHLGNGASLAAVRDGRCIDTSMGFTPTAGLVMSSRSGDLDPGLVAYLHHIEQMTPQQFHDMANHQSGLLGISDISSDMRELLDREAGDLRAADAIAVFCYQSKKWIGAYAAALGGLDTLVFAGGIGEHCPPIRERICDGLGFLDLALDPTANACDAAIISMPDSRVTVRVIPTDEERVIAEATVRLLENDTKRAVNER
jgi:acetate kinase